MWFPNIDLLYSGRSGLAIEIHKMLTSNQAVHYPNPVDDMLEQKSKGMSFIQSKTTKSCVGVALILSSSPKTG